MQVGFRHLPWRALVAASLVASSVVACSGASPDERAPGTTSEGELCQSGGIHVESCGSGGPIGHPVVPRLQSCAPNPDCATQPDPGFATASYDPAQIKQAPPPGGTCALWATDSDLPGRLADAGCGPQTYYYARHSPRAVWATAACPVPVLVPGALNEGEIPCDSCTADPPVGWHIIAWEVVPGNEVCANGRIPLPHPNPSCNDLTCLTEVPD